MANELPDLAKEDGYMMFRSLLQSIDITQKRQLAVLEELLALSKQKRAAPQPTAQPVANVAPDSDLESQYGDELVRFKPRDWTGDFVKNQRMSESDPKMLDMLADAFEYFAQKNDAEGNKTDSGKPKSIYDRRSAARARGWAARLRANWKPKAAVEPMSSGEVKW